MHFAKMRFVSDCYTLVLYHAISKLHIYKKSVVYLSHSSCCFFLFVCCFFLQDTRNTCPYHQSLLSFRMRSRSSMPSHTSSSLDLVVTMSCGLTLQICLIIALSFRCRRWRFGFVNGQVSLAWSIVLRTQELYTQPRVLKERWREERTGSRSLNFFQAVFTRVVVESSQPPAAESMSPR